jgi:hypothetical protein
MYDPESRTIDKVDDGESSFLAQEDTIAAGIQKARTKLVSPTAKGYCLNPKCGEDLEEGKRFCDPHCRDAYDAYIKR